jgi:hypothetical protein
MSTTNGTLIQLKYSTVNSAPTTLQQSEPAYSFVSNKFFIGTGSDVVAIGGQFYTALIDANTSYATPGTIVTRDGNGAANFGGVLSNTLYSNTTIYAGYANGIPGGATNPLIGAIGNANNYVQNYIKNIDNEMNSSADFVAYPDNGSDVSGWIDMGIGSSTYGDPYYSVSGPNEGYILMSAPSGSGTSGNLVIGTDSTGVYNDIVFSTGSLTSGYNPIAHFRNEQGLVIDITTESSSNSSGALVVSGGAGVQGALYADRLYDSGGRVLSVLNTNTGPGIGISTSVSGNTETVTITNLGVQSLSANSGDTTVSGSTGNLTFGLATTGVSAGTYGGTTQIPTIIVDSKGRITYAGNNTVATSFTVSGDSGSGTLNGGGTLTFTGGGGVTTSVSGSGGNETVTFNTDNTIVRSNTAGAYQTIDGVLNITGDLNVTGNISYTDVATIVTQNSLIFLANNNTSSDVVDIGFVGESFNGDNVVYTGLFRHAGDSGKDYYLFDGYTTNPDGTFVIDPTDASFRVSTLHANLVASLVTSGGFLAQEGNPTGIGGTGYSFQNDGGYDTGMFSPSDGLIQLWSNNVKILEGQLNQGYTLQNNTRLADTTSNGLIIGVGANAGGDQGSNAIAIGTNAAYTNQYDSAVAIGYSAGYQNQNVEAVAIGANAGFYAQGIKTVAIGSEAGRDTQGNFSVAIGHNAAANTQSNSSVAIGHIAGQNSQQNDAVAIGVGAGFNNQNAGAVALGMRAGYGNVSPQGAYSIAIGYAAGYDTVYTNSIILNASGTSLDTTTSGFFVNPVRNTTTSNLMFYNVSTSELSYGSLDASAIASGTLGVTYGGTGSSSFNTKGVVVSDNSSSTGALTALTGSAYQVLQLDASGIPTFGTLNGGTF